MNKELSIEEKAKAYDEAIKKLHEIITMDNKPVTPKEIGEYLFPELKESEDERIKKCVKYAIDKLFLKEKIVCDVRKNDVLAWLEKQGNTNEPINRDKFAQGVLRGAAINLITWIDYNAAEGNMCLSNMECKDIEDSLVNGNWDKIYAYIKKKLEKQSEQKPAWSEDNLPEFESYLCLMFQKFRTKGICTNGEIIDFVMEHTQKLKDILVKTPWTEEDEKQARQIERIVRNDGCSKKLQEQIANWFKSLKDRVQPQPKQEWSEEDGKMLVEIVKDLQVCKA